MNGREVLARLLRHEAKANTAKFALVRALNDLAVEHPLLPDTDIVVPLRRVAERWLVYYWPFVGERPVYQGARAFRNGALIQDISFRPHLTALRSAWEALPYARSHPAEGAMLLTDYQVGRGISPELLTQTRQTIQAITQAVRQPVRYGGGGGPHTLFSAPALVGELPGVPLPGSRVGETGFLVPAGLWQALRELSLWVEALCLHEWSLYLEKVAQDVPVTRGKAFELLTAEPEARVPLTWERNQVRLQMLEGAVFRCPWTDLPLTPQRFDLDHLIPVAARPINELWNLLPSDPHHNSHVKRARIPSTQRLLEAQPRITLTYSHYAAWPPSQVVLARDTSLRFGEALEPQALVHAVTSLADLIAQARNVPRY